MEEGGAANLPPSAAHHHESFFQLLNGGVAEPGLRGDRLRALQYACLFPPLDTTRAGIAECSLGGGRPWAVH